MVRRKGQLGAVHPRGLRPLLGGGGAPKGLEASDEDEPLREVARRVGLDPEELLRGSATDEAKQALKGATSEAAQRGVFATPTFFVGDEMFWGNDRLDFVQEALKG